MALRKSIVDFADTHARVDWRSGLPELSDGHATVRELRASDAGSLVTHLGDPQVSRFIAPCPGSESRFARFIRWAQAERRRGKLAAFGLAPAGGAAAVGVIQLWPVESDFSTAEWGFALGRAFWGTGLFISGARLVLDGVFRELGVHRLEARAVEANARGNRVLEKLGARRDGVLRDGFRDGAVFRNHVMWSILASEWQ